MGEIGLTVPIKADLSSFRRSLSDVNRDFARFGKDGASAFKGAETQAERLGARTDKLSRSVGAASREVKGFGSDGSRAFNLTDKEAKQLDRTIDGVTASFREAGTAADTFGRKGGKAFDGADSGVKRLSGSTSVLSTSLRTLTGILAGLGIARLVNEGFALANQYNSINLAFKASTGSVKLAGESFDFARKEANRLSTDLFSGAAAFSQLSNAVKETSLEGIGVQRIFSGLSETTNALGRSNDEFNRIMIAAGQILGGTTIKQEELNQLREAGIPAEKELAKALGITGQALRDALSRQKVPAQALLLLTESLSKNYKKIAEEVSLTSKGAFQQLINQTQETTAQFFGAILASETLAEELRKLTGLVKEFGNSLNHEEITRVTNAVTVLGGALVKTLLTALDSVTKEMSFWLKLMGQASTAISNLNNNLKVTETISAIGQKLQDSWDIFTTGKIQTDSVAEVNTSLLEAGEILTELGVVSSALEGDIGDVKNIFQVFDDLLPSITKGADDTADWMSKLDKLLAGVRDKMKDVIEGGKIPGPTKDDIKLYEELNDVIDKAGKAFDDFLSGQVQSVKEGLDRRIELETRHLNDLNEAELDAFIERNRQSLELTRAGEEARTENRITLIKKRITEELKLEADFNDRIDQIVKDARDARDKEAIKAADDLINDMRRPFEQAFEAIQDAGADAFEELFSGELNSVKDFAESLKDIVIRTLAEIASAEFIGKPLQSILENFGQPSPTGPDTEGRTTGAAALANQQRFSQIAGGAGLGVGSGFATSGIISQAGGGGALAGGLGGAVGGAVFGGTVGSVFPGIGTLIGAAVGAIVGGIAGALASSFSGSGQGTQRIHLQTTADRPSVTPSDNAQVRGAFGVVSLLNEASSRTNAHEISSAIAEIDRSIANLITSRQRELVAAQLQAVGSRIYAQGTADTDEAINQVITDRFRIILTAIAGSDVSTTVIGEGPSGNIQALERRVQDALGILAQIEEFRDGPASEAATAIAAVNKEFENLISRAEEFGIGTAEIVAEQQRRIAEVANVINADVSQRILELTDADAAAVALLEKRQADELQNATDANADLTELERLHVLEREALAEQLSDANEDADEATSELVDKFQQALDIIRGNTANLSLQEQLEQEFTDFKTPPLDGFQGELLALSERFNRVTEAANLVGRSTDDLRQAYARLAGDIRTRQALSVAQSGVSALDTPQQQLERVFQDFAQSGNANPFNQQLDDLRDRFEGLTTAANIVGRSTGDLERAYNQLSGTIRTQQALAVAQQGASALDTPAQQLERVFQDFADQGSADPLNQELNSLQDRFEGLVLAADMVGRSTGDLTQSYNQLAGAIHTQRALTVAQQGASALDTPAQQLERVFQDFNTQAGADPLNQELDALQDQFEGLVLAANMVGRSTGDLTQSYNQLAGAIHIQRALTVAQQGASALDTPAQQLERVFQDFNSQGNVDPFISQMDALKDQFGGLVLAANMVGRSTGDLQAAYQRLADNINTQRALAVAQQGISALDTPAQQLQRVFEDFVNSGSTDPFNQELDSLRDKFEGLTAAAIMVGRSTNDLRIRYNELVEDIRFRRALSFAQQGVDANLTPRQQLNREFETFTGEGPQSTAGQELDTLRNKFKGLLLAAVTVGRSTADLTAKFNELSADIRDRAVQSVQSFIFSLTDPFQAAAISASNQINEFSKLLEDGLISRSLFKEMKDVAVGSALVTEALRRMGGGPSSAIEQAADSFQAFIRAGNPLSEFGQQFFDLTENFLNLKDAAELLGLSTGDLEASFEAQAQQLRDQLLENIDAQLESRRAGVQSITDFLSQLQVSDTLPVAQRLDAAQGQFETALGGDDVGRILQSAEQLREVARAQFGSSAGFFEIENQIEQALNAFKEQEQLAIEAERQRLVAQAEREQQQIQIGNSSLDLLQRMTNQQSRSVDGIDTLIALAQQNERSNVQTQNLLERVIVRGNV